jgi:hypothetical protein
MLIGGLLRGLKLYDADVVIEVEEVYFIAAHLARFGMGLMLDIWVEVELLEISSVLVIIIDKKFEFFCNFLLHLYYILSYNNYP